MKCETSYFNVSSCSAPALCIASEVLEQALAPQDAMSWFLLLTQYKSSLQSENTSWNCIFALDPCVWLYSEAQHPAELSLRSVEQYKPSGATQRAPISPDRSPQQNFACRLFFGGLEFLRANGQDRSTTGNRRASSLHSDAQRLMLRIFMRLYGVLQSAGLQANSR